MHTAQSTQRNLIDFSSAYLHKIVFTCITFSSVICASFLCILMYTNYTQLYEALWTVRRFQILPPKLLLFRDGHSCFFRAFVLFAAYEVPKWMHNIAITKKSLKLAELRIALDKNSIHFLNPKASRGRTWFDRQALGSGQKQC